MLLFYGVRTTDLFVYGDVAREQACTVPSLTANLICEAADGRLAVDRAWPAVAELQDPAFYLSGPPAMLTALTGQLHGRGVPPEAVRIDAWE